MVKIYVLMLAIGFLAVLVLVMGGTLADNLNRSDRDPGATIGARGRLVLGAVLGFGMGGMAAEFSPFDLTWPIALVIALLAGVLGAFWVRYATRIAADS